MDQKKFNFKKILVTGATGFIGSNVVKRLDKRNIEIIAIDNNFRGITSRLKDTSNKVTFYDFDIRDLNKFIEYSKNCDCIIHLAYINGTKNFYSMPHEVLDVAIKSILNVFEVCKINQIKNLFIASSSEVFHEPNTIPTDENVPLIIPDISNPRYSYSAGKILYEVLGKHYYTNLFDRIVLFRPFNVYGKDMGMGHVIPQIIDRIKRNNLHLITNKRKAKINFEIEGNGFQTRAFEHIEDFVDGLEIILQKGLNREIYNIGNDEEISINKLVSKIFNCINNKLDINIVQNSIPKGGTNRRCPNISKLRKLGYKPKISIDKGLPEVIDFYLKSEN